MEEHMSKMNRRSFVTGLAAGAVGLGAGKYAGAAPGRENFPGGLEEAAKEIKIRKYNPLGNTGLKVSDIICGVNSVFSANTLAYAYDLGVNTFDTAETYMGGRSEEFIGEALGKVRDKVIIITKHGYAPGRPPTKAGIIDRFNKSLKRMKTDYVDIAFLHGLTGVDLLKNQELLETYGQLRKEGKLRFTGFSTHANIAGVLKGCDNPEFLKFVQVVLFSYNHMEGEPLKPLIAKLRKKGVGTVAMKTLAGGKQGKLKPFVKGGVSYPQAALSWVLADKNMDCAVITMSTYSHVEEYVAASNMKLSGKDLAALRYYREAVHDKYCRFDCSACESVCPAQVAVSDVMRYKMYFQDYGREKQAIQHYAALQKEKKPLNCVSCPGFCGTACPYGLKVKEDLIAAHDILTV